MSQSSPAVSLRLALVCGALLAFGPAASAQTVDQSEESLAYLTDKACMAQDVATAWSYSTDPFTPCVVDLQCASVQGASCQHRSLLEAADSLYPALEFPPAPDGPGTGEGTLRYVPLCEDGSGDHEYAVTGGAFGTAPTCATEDFVRCADGERPYYWLDAATPNPSPNWVIHAGGGGAASAPNEAADDASVWQHALTNGNGAYSADPAPPLHGDLTGIFADGGGNPFRTYNRIFIEKCTPDTWLGNRSHHLADYDGDPAVTASVPIGDCDDSDDDGDVCEEAGCVCHDVTLPPPEDASGVREYDVHYHGKRIVRAVLSDVVAGPVAWETYPLGLNASGTALLPGGSDHEFPPLAADAIVAINCHSNGCNGLQGGHIDDIDTYLDDLVEDDVRVRALFNSWLPPVAEVEQCVSDYDGVSVTVGSEEYAAHVGIIDDASCSVYDQVVDPVGVTTQPVSRMAFEPDGRVLNSLVDWYEPAPDYDPPVDATCLADHCPNTADWATDPACAPCNDSVHVLLNHLQTPFFYNTAQRDVTISKDQVKHCEDGTGQYLFCDFQGRHANGGVNLVPTHYRPAVRKQLADLLRDAESLRCEAASGTWPYDHIRLVSPRWADHGGLHEDAVATTTLDPQGPIPPTELRAAAFNFVNTLPTKDLCLQEAVAGENAAHFPVAVGPPTIIGCQ